ncbi:MAG: putative Adenylate cyclase [Pedosphaera sp.]|nr:putative Adenylate cyclase [Pedosphaera sp.]
MIALSFRIKLLLAMMILVVGAMGATLYVTQEKVQATYLKLFQDQFEAEANYFILQQDSRLSGTKDKSAELAKSPALREALAAGQTNAIYEIWTNFLNQQIQQNPRAGRLGLRGNVPGGGLALMRNPMTFFRVLNARGEILRFPDARGGALLKQAARKRIEGQLVAVQEAITTLEEQPIGYLAPERTNGQVELLEVIVTKISDPDTKQTLGALVLGVPIFLESSEKPMYEMSHGEVESGIWVENQIHSKTIPPELREEFAKLLALRTKLDGQSQDPVDITLGKVPRRVFFKLLNPNSPFPPAYQVSVYSLVSALKTQQELRWQILAFSAAALAGALILSLLIAHGLSIPLRELVKGTEAIRSGNFQVKVPVRSRDELGKLASSFNEMAEGLVEKERYRTILNMVADEKVAHALVNGQLALGGEVREVSVLFCDVRNFTALTENMPPQEVIEMLNEHMTLLARIVKEHNGVLDKFVGDLLMAIFGAPLSHENDTLNAARCALQLIREREQLNATSRHQLHVGIGVASGRVVAGCMGSADRLNYTVLGERVNLASRLCSQAGPGQVVIDQTTKDKLGETASTIPLPALNLKGFTENVMAYELTGVQFKED